MDCVNLTQEGTFRTYVVISMKTKACCVSYSNHQEGVGSAMCLLPELNTKDS